MATLTKSVSSQCHWTMRAKVEEILASTPGKKVTHIWTISSVPDHNNLRCTDFMIKSIADGQAVFDYIWARRVRYGVRLIIWNGRIVRTYDKVRNGKLLKAGVSEKYTGPNPHRDHPHVEFNDRPLDKAATKPPTPAKKAAAKPTYTITANGGLWARSGAGKNLKVLPKGTVLTVVRFAYPQWDKGEKYAVTTTGTYYNARYLKK